jgi:2-polyprenyl-3-methyl-5-hydroxy-6-metoxy-1,4-benzoquinol methylase
MGWRALLIHGDPCVLDRWLWVRRHVRKDGARTFDAGCGNGGFAIYAAVAGNEVVAASFSAEELQHASHRAALVDAPVDFEVIDLRDLASHAGRLGAFDQILCLETIEHLSDDQGILSNLASMLKPNGQLLLTTPSMDHPPLLGESRDPDPVEDGGHVRYGYTKERVQELLTNAGLTVTHHARVSGVISQRLTNLMRRLERRMPTPLAWLLLLPLRTLVILDRPLTEVLGYPYLSVTARAVSAAAA